MQRILILGSPGTGKSTLARELSHHLQLPLYHLDQFFFEAHWVINEPAFKQKLHDVLHEDRWIIDGNYAASLPQRLSRADTVIYLDYPTPIALSGIIKRYWRYKHTTRPDMAPGCLEQLKPSFLWYVLTFKRKKRKQTFASLTATQIPVYFFHSRKETATFIRTLTN
ncbi:topology modulation protein [Halolactibacillus miurensis]|uniref:Adenylate kinase n=1 Tax=Halolactibacillus miurensis TaxID=306541 RepID=A0A1I6Q5R4_9BACI|nr:MULTISPECIES: AAA family ATPase [Halolactibacillus]GEM03273.1 topology modulation protein [Halolactibacillus miurensis]SFS47698.1 Adenylate kinase [Halolactibacillus miurensis]